MNKNTALTISIVLFIVAMIGLSFVFDKTDEEVFGEIKTPTQVEVLNARIDALEKGISEVVTCQFGVDEAGQPVYNLCGIATQEFINREIARQQQQTNENNN